MIYKYRDRDFTGINGHMFAHKGIPKVDTPYFYIEDLSGQSNTLSIVKNDSRAPTLTIEESMDGKNWTVLGTTSTTAITATIPANGKLYLRCSTNFWAFMDIYGLQYNHISVSDHCSIGGNIMSLLYGVQFTGNETVFPSGHQQSGDVFSRLFIDCDTIIRAGALVLPVIELTQAYCYAEMFSGCTALTTAPELPATTLTEGCYDNMFSGCTALTTVPELPATTLADYCYYCMFGDCASLTTAPTLPATTLTEGCYSSMFWGCTSLTTAPTLPATTLTDYCYQYMFWSCTSLTTAPVLPATTLADSCYDSMFYGCTSLSEVKCLAYDISAFNCLNIWLYDVAVSGTFYKKAGVVYRIGVNGIPRSWTVVEV